MRQNLYCPIRNTEELAQRLLYMNILIAPSGFKENLSSEEVADYIAEGVAHAIPDANIIKVPLVDGGEGFAQSLVKATSGTMYSVLVTGPVGLPVKAQFGILGGTGPKTAIMEMASAAGLRQVPEGMRDPLRTTTFGVGELIKAALNTGARRLLIGCGDSGTTDGGAGMAQALGVRLLDSAGESIGWGGAELARIAHVDLSRIDARIEHVQIDVACNFNSLLCGPSGAAPMFGPQKGATPSAVDELSRSLEHFSAVLKRELNIDVTTLPGGGAAGGLGAGLHAFLKANLYHRYEIIMRYLEIDAPLNQADLVITAEGCIDFSTAKGKIPCEVARRARELGTPTVALVGMIGKGAEVTITEGLDVYTSILDSPTQLFTAMNRAPELLKKSAESLMRTIMVGKKLAESARLQRELEEEETATSRGFESPTMPVSGPGFVNQLSQDMRTPLNLVIAYSKMLLDGLLGEVTPPQRKALLQVIKHSYWQLSMVNGLLQSAIGTDKKNPVAENLGTRVERIMSASSSGRLSS